MSRRSGSDKSSWQEDAYRVPAGFDKNIHIKCQSVDKVSQEEAIQYFVPPLMTRSSLHKLTSALLSTKYVAVTLFLHDLLPLKPQPCVS